jgi:putative membrane protein
VIQLLLRWFIAAAALWLTVVAGQRLNLDMKLTGPMPAIIAVAALAVANTVIRPIVKLLTLPITCLTLGLFGFVINALIFWLVGETGIVHGFEVHGFLAALFGSVLMGIICGIANGLIRKKED